MFTSTAKQLFAALGKGAQPVVQGLANCQQPLSHRGPVSLSPGRRGSRDGTYNARPWSPLGAPLPPAGSTNKADLPSSPSPWNSYNTGFYFPTDQYFTQNQFYGGPTFHVAGDSYADTFVAQTVRGEAVRAKDLSADTLNGEPQGGPPGPPGAPGADGVPGAPGALFVLQGMFGVGQFQELFFLNGAAPFVALTTAEIRVPTTATLDPETCDITLGGYTTHTVVTNARLEGLIRESRTVLHAPPAGINR